MNDLKFFLGPKNHHQWQKSNFSKLLSTTIIDDRNFISDLSTNSKTFLFTLDIYFDSSIKSPDLIYCNIF